MAAKRASVALCGGKPGDDDHDPLDGPAAGRLSFSCANMVPCPRRLPHGVQARAGGLVWGSFRPPAYSRSRSAVPFLSLTPRPAAVLRDEARPLDRLNALIGP